MEKMDVRVFFFLSITPSLHHFVFFSRKYMNIYKLIRWFLVLYLITLITVSVIPLGSVSREITNVTVIHLRGDYFLHLLVYLPVVSLLMLSLQKWKWKMLLVAFGVAIGLEYIQMLLPYRSFNINDLIANASGVLVGALIYPLITRISRIL